MLNKISFIGVDTKTNFDHMNLISRFGKQEGVDVEFGVLYSKTNTTNRYVQPDFINSFLEASKKSSVTPSIHLCGKDIITDFVNNDFRICKGFDKVQLNINFDKFEAYEIYYPVREFLLLDHKHTIVFQYSKRSFEKVLVILEAFRRNEKSLLDQLVVLFDGSGGYGKVLETPQMPIAGHYCGYAGGISPDTVEAIVERIESLGFSDEYYIDMESGVREDDWFSLNHCFLVLEKVIDLKFEGKFS